MNPIPPVARTGDDGDLRGIKENPMKTKRQSNLSNALKAQVTAGAFWKCFAKPKPTTAPKPSIDELVRKYTEAQTLDELCEVGKETSYRPSIYVRGNAEKKRLADAYDARQAELGDPRRAFRGW